MYGRLEILVQIKEVQGSSAKQVAAYVPVCEPFSSGMHLNRQPVELVAENGQSFFVSSDIRRRETLKRKAAFIGIARSVKVNYDFLSTFLIF